MSLEENTHQSLFNKEKALKYAKWGGAAVGVACAVPMAAGFGTAGIVGGSFAAMWQSSIGSVVAGSAFATLQSLGATGVFATGAAAGTTASAGAFIAGKVSKKNLVRKMASSLWDLDCRFRTSESGSRDELSHRIGNLR